MKSTTASLLFILAIIAALFGTPAHAATAPYVAAEVELAEPEEEELGPTATVASASSSSSFLKKKRELQGGSSSSSSSDTSSMSLMSYGDGPGAVPVSIYVEVLRLRYPRTYTMLYGPRPVAWRITFCRPPSHLYLSKYISSNSLFLCSYVFLRLPLVLFHEVLHRH